MSTLTPLYSALTAFSSSAPLRLHMPGHKGRPLPGLDYPTGLDFTELPPTGNLYEPGGPIEAAERLWADFVGMEQCLFLTGGSTQGIHTALRSATRHGGAVLADRVSHRSIHTGLALLGTEVHWLQREPLPDCDTVGPLTPAQVEAGLVAHPEAKTVVVTSPTYYGVLSDLAGIGEVCHRHGAKLVVDGAHGAHLPMLSGTSFTGADYVVVSAHKTLRAPGQTAFLFANGCSLEELQRSSLLFATSSPSYAMMAALDCLRPWCEGEGGVRYRRTAEETASLRAAYPCLCDTDTPLDPCRLTLCVEDGDALGEALMARGIYPEMTDLRHVVLILTEADEPEDYARLRSALDELGLKGKERPHCDPIPLPELPPQRCSIRDALFLPTEEVCWEESVGRVAAEALAPYPPGIPIVTPGEEITKKVLAYLEQMRYNKEKIVVVRS